jgi:hypothetical protein
MAAGLGVDDVDIDMTTTASVLLRRHVEEAQKKVAAH